MRAQQVNESLTRKLSYKDREGNLYYFSRKSTDDGDVWLHDEWGKYLDHAPDKISLIWQWDLKHIPVAEQTLSKNSTIRESWHEGIEFGKARNDFGTEPKPMNNTKQKKIWALEKKAQKIYDKIELGKNPYGSPKFFRVSVRKHVMSGVEKVDYQEALNLISDAISNVERTGSTGGIIIYI